MNNRSLFLFGGVYLLLTTEVEQKWNNRTRTHYEQLGYIFTKNGNVFIVNVEELTHSSTVYVKVRCDYCEIIFAKKYYKFLKGRENILKDCCNNTTCKRKKREEVCLLKYNVENPSKIPEVRNKARNTMIERYGTDNPLEVPEFIEKRKQTCLDAYGVEYPLQSDLIKNKMMSTNLKKYGVEFTFQTEIVKEKTKETNMRKYGVPHISQSKEYQEKVAKSNMEKYGYRSVLQVPEIQEKITQSLYENGTTPTSSQQLEIYNMLKKNQYDVGLNYPVSNVSLDVAIFIDENIKIDLEYDGSYWHKDQQYDRRRDEFLKSQGWKILRIKSRRKVPSLEDVVSSINKLIDTDRTFTSIILDDVQEVISS